MLGLRWKEINSQAFIQENMVNNHYINKAFDNDGNMYV